MIGVLHDKILKGCCSGDIDVFYNNNRIKVSETAFSNERKSSHLLKKGGVHEMLQRLTSERSVDDGSSDKKGFCFLPKSSFQGMG